jgi:hypothetical protein
MSILDSAVTVQTANGQWTALNVGQLVVNLNADKLDGKHATAFAASSHFHILADITDFTAAVGQRTCREFPGGVINGVNALFTTTYVYITGDLRIYLNGLRQRYAVDFIENPGLQSFTMTTPPSNTGYTDFLEVEYSY